MARLRANGFWKSVLLLIAVNLTQGAEIIGDRNVAPQHTVQLSLKDLPAKAAVVWKIKPFDGQESKDIEWVSTRKDLHNRWIGPQGKYEVSCTYAIVKEDGTLDFDVMDVVITIGSPAPPKPVVPDELVTALQAAYDQCQEPDRAQIKAGYIALYRQGAEVIKRSEITTYKQFFDIVEATAVQAKINQKILPVQIYVNKNLTGLGVPLISNNPIVNKDIISTMFLKYAAALEQVK